MERCECCDLPLYSCGRSKETELRREWRRNQAALEAQGWLKALYPVTCHGCREKYPVGTLIRMSACGWVAECCGEKQLTVGDTVTPTKR